MSDVAISLAEVERLDKVTLSETGKWSKQIWGETESQNRVTKEIELLIRSFSIKQVWALMVLLVNLVKHLKKR